MKTLPAMPAVFLALLLSACATQDSGATYAAADEPHAVVQLPGIRNFGAGPYYPALLTYIDGRHVPLDPEAWIDEDDYVPGPADQTRFRVTPGRHVLTADINRQLIVHNLPSGETGRLVPGRFEARELEATLEPGKHYVISAVVPIDDYDAWYPVLLEVEGREIVGVVAEGEAVEN